MHVSCARRPSHPWWPTRCRPPRRRAVCSAPSPRASTSSWAATSECSPCSPRMPFSFPSACGWPPPLASTRASGRATWWSSGAGGCVARRRRRRRASRPAARVRARAACRPRRDAERLSPDAGRARRPRPRPARRPRLAGRPPSTRPCEAPSAPAAGLTPSGDDALCGVLLTLGAFEPTPPRRGPSPPCGRSSCRRCRTTSLSAALLSASRRGMPCPTSCASSPSWPLLGPGGAVERHGVRPPRQAVWGGAGAVRSGTRDPTGRHTTSRWTGCSPSVTRRGATCSPACRAPCTRWPRSLDPEPVARPACGAHRA